MGRARDGTVRVSVCFPARSWSPAWDGTLCRAPSSMGCVTAQLQPLPSRPAADVPCHQALQRAAGVWHGAAVPLCTPTHCPPASWQPWSPVLSLQQGVLIAVCLITGMKRSTTTWSPLGCLGEAKAFCCPPCPSHQHIPALAEVGTGGAGTLLGVSAAAQGAPGPPSRGRGARAEHTAPMMGFCAAL